MKESTRRMRDLYSFTYNRIMTWRSNSDKYKTYESYLQAMIDLKNDLRYIWNSQKLETKRQRELKNAAIILVDNYLIDNKAFNIYFHDDIIRGVRKRKPDNI